MPTPTTAEIISKFSDPEQRQELLNSWPSLRCALCHNKAATGIWWCQFYRASAPWIRSELKPLCAACGLTDCYAKWTGFMGPKLLRCDLFATITAPPGDKRTPADKMIEAITNHPSGGQYILAWTIAFRPANRSHPTEPAMRALQNAYLKLFPPQDNKVD